MKFFTEKASEFIWKRKIFFYLICEIFNNQKAPSKITRYVVNLQKENVFAVSHVGRKSENDPKINMNLAFSTMIKKTHQFQSIKSNKEVTPRLGKFISFTENLKN